MDAPKKNKSRTIIVSGLGLLFLAVLGYIKNDLDGCGAYSFLIIVGLSDRFKLFNFLTESQNITVMFIINVVVNILVIGGYGAFIGWIRLEDYSSAKRVTPRVVVLTLIGLLIVFAFVFPICLAG